MSTPTPSDFLWMMESRLRPTHTPFSRAALIAFIEAAWPAIADDPDVEYYANEFLQGETMAPA
jgi:hypothetical protein